MPIPRPSLPGAGTRLELPPTDDTQCKVGYGITVAVEGHTIRGGERFMDLEGVEIAPEVAEAPATWTGMSGGAGG